MPLHAGRCGARTRFDFFFSSAAAILLIADAVTPALGQPTGEQEQTNRFEEIVVTASRSGRSLEELPLSVSIIDEAELATQLRYSTNVLRSIELAVPGFAPQTDDRVGCSVGLRGRTTSFQVNGVPVNQDLRQSSCNAMFQISPFAVERIEVVRGGTALYGAGAPGGIVNLITRRAAGAEMEVDTVLQSTFNPSESDDTFTTDLFAGVGQAFEAWDYYAGVAYTNAGVPRTPDGGYVPSREYDSVALNGSLGLSVGSDGTLRATVTYYNEEPESQYSADGSQVFGERFANVIRVADHPQLGESKDRLATLSVAYQQPRFLGHELTASVFYQDQEYAQRDNFYDVNFGGDFFFASETENERIGLRSALVKRLISPAAAELSVTYGVDYTSNRFYRPTVEPADGGRITGFVAPDTTLETHAAFAQVEAGVGDFRFTAGIRQEWYRGDIGSEGYDPSLPDAGTPGDLADSDLALWNAGVVYQLTPTTQIYGGFSQGAELSEIGRAARGIADPNLISPEPADSDQFEVGIRRTQGELAFEAVAFRSESDSAALLQADPTCVGQQFCPLIPLRLPQEFWGAELSADWAATEKLQVRAALTSQRGEVLNDALGEMIDYSNDTIAPLRLTAFVGYAPADFWRFGFQATYYGEADFYSQPEQALGFVNTESQFLVDANLGFSLGSGELYVAASNLLDDEYVNVVNQAFGFDFYYYQAAGRRITVGYSSRF